MNICDSMALLILTTQPEQYENYGFLSVLYIHKFGWSPGRGGPGHTWV